MCKKHKEGNFNTINLKPHLSQLVKVPISVIATNRIEVIDHTDWLHNKLNIYGGGFKPLISSCTDSYVIQFFYSLISFTDVRK